MAQGDLTVEQATSLVGPPPTSGAMPMTTGEVAALGTSGTSLNAPPVIGDTRRTEQALGETVGVPFHQEGLPVWTDIMAKSQANKEEEIKYLVRKFGAQNVRLNEFDEPVVRITDPETGKPEDFPLNPRQLTVRSLSGLMRLAPDIAGGIAAYYLTGPGGVVKKSFQSAVGSEAGGILREIAAGAGSRAASQGLGAVKETPVKEPFAQHLANIPIDMALDLGLIGLVKGGQVVKGLGAPKFLGGGGLNIPNPVAGTVLTQPARPEFTKAGVEAARELQTMTGISPELRVSETTGIPVAAMIEQYFERTPAGAAPQIAAQTKRENASKAIQNWMVDPTTLATDEEIGRRGLAALKKTVEPYEKAVATARAEVEVEEQALAAATKAKRTTVEQQLKAKFTADQTEMIKKAMDITRIPETGVDLAPIGEALSGKAVQMRDAAKAEHDALYNAFRAHPMANEPVVPGAGLKAEIDKLRAKLPSVTKEVETPVEGGLVGPTGQPLTETTVKRVPVPTPIRPRLDMLSAKLENGTVSINDLKEIRTDVGNAIAYGEPFAGYKEGRLKALYAKLSSAIDQGLEQIGDPELTALWNKASEVFERNAAKFEQKDVARIFKEAEQAGSIGPNAFTKKAMIDPDLYASLGKFYGVKSSEMAMLRDTIKTKTLSDALAPDGLIDGGQLTRLLKTMKDERPSVFKDVFGDRGNDMIKAADQLGSWQQKVPIEEIEKLLGPNAQRGAPSVKLIALQNAQKKLDEQYALGPVHEYLTGKLPLSEINPERFVAGAKNYKLSDVQEMMRRIEAEDPAAAEMFHRKAVQNLLVESRRSATSADTMAKSLGEPGELISATGLSNALGSGDQLKKYEALLGPIYKPLQLYVRQELLGEQRREVARGVGMLAPGSAVSALRKALTPWEGNAQGKGLLMELSGLARDKIFSVAIANPKIQNWLMSPYALKEAPNAIRAVILSEPFIKGMLEEFKDKDALSQALSALKVAFGTAGATESSPGQRPGDMTPEQASKLVPKP